MALDVLPVMSMIWAQATPDPDAVPLLALRRWTTGLTLSSPEPVPGWFPVWVWLGGVGVLVLLAMIAQGPVRALGQLLDVAGHVRLLAAALARLRDCGRLVAVLFGATVLAWTASQFASYNRPERLDELVVLHRSQGIVELAWTHGVLAGLTPLRDLCGLGDLLLLLLAATVLVFRLSAETWGNYDSPEPEPAPVAGGTVLWLAGGSYAFYRLASLLLTERTGGLPLGGCLAVEAVLIPLGMALCDGLLLSWVLAELRGAGQDDEGAGSDRRAILALVPAATLACLATLPARYAATAAWLALPFAPADGLVRPALLALVRGWGPAVLQGGSVALLGLVGAVAAGRGGPGAAIRGYARLLRAEGGHVAAAVTLGSLTAGAAAAGAYALILSLPAQPWVLPTADGYAHYVTLPVGLVLAAALVELGQRAGPPAKAAPAPDLV
ncbi:MAG TPA: hypothetical protein VF590_14575, partial [Isosphaeraceae bacterium]